MILQERERRATAAEPWRRGGAWEETRALVESCPLVGARTDFKSGKVRSGRSSEKEVGLVRGEAGR